MKVAERFSQVLPRSVSPLPVGPPHRECDLCRPHARRDAREKSLPSNLDFCPNLSRGSPEVKVHELSVLLVGQLKCDLLSEVLSNRPFSVFRENDGRGFKLWITQIQ